MVSSSTRLRSKMSSEQINEKSQIKNYFALKFIIYIHMNVDKIYNVFLEKLSLIRIFFNATLKVKAQTVYTN